jgi:mitotic spindle assembly checkpoint protein MAD1
MRYDTDTVQMNMARQISELRSSNQNTGSILHQLEIEHSNLKRSHSLLLDNTNNERTVFQSRMKELEEVVERSKGWKRRAEGLSIELEEERRKGLEKRREEEDDKEDKRTENVVRKELKSGSPSIRLKCKLIVS